MPKQGKKKNKSLLYKLPLFLFVLVLLLFVNKSIKILKSGGKQSMDIGNLSLNLRGGKSIDVPADWKEYNSTDYRFVVKIPPLLLERVYTGQNEYLLFVKFEENKFSTQKGVAVGVTNRTVDEEIKKIRDGINKNLPLNPKERIIKIDGLDAIRFDYEAEGFYESRSVVVVSNGKITVSLSTTPDQIDTLITGFDFY